MLKPTGPRQTVAPFLMLLAAAATPAFGQKQAEPIRTTRVSGWTVVQHSHGCDLTRAGSSAPAGLPDYHRPFRGDTRLNLGAPAAPPPGLRFASVSPVELRAGVGKVPAQVRLTAVIDTRTSGFQPYSLMMVSLAGANETAFRRLLGSAPDLAVIFKGRTAATAPLPPLAAWQEADRCLGAVGEALLTASPPIHPNGTPPPRDKPWPRQAPGRWFGSESYPPEAVRAKAQGNSRVSVAVDRWGYPTSCKVVQSAGHKTLDALACSQIMARGSFFPALDKAGAATAGVWESTVVWRVGAD